MTEEKTKVKKEITATQKLNEGVVMLLDDIKSSRKRDYRKFTYEEKEQLLQMVNTSRTLSQRIGEKLS